MNMVSPEWKGLMFHPACHPYRFHEEFYLEEVRTHLAYQSLEMFIS